MQYRKLGQTSLDISEISLGAMSLPSDQKTCDNIIHYALDHGVNLIDTADLYEKGVNEKKIGKSLEQKRKNLFLATKVGNQWNENGIDWTWNPTKSYIIKAVELSLKRLKTDYIDLYQLHGGTIDDPMEESVEAFETLVKQGKIRFYGISSIRPNVIRAYSGLSNIQSVMMQYSLLDRRPEDTVLPALAQKKISIMVRGGLAKGLLIDKPPKPYLNYKTNEVQNILSKFRQHFSGREYQIAIAYVLKNPTVCTTVVGVSNLSQLKKLVALPSLSIDQDEMELLQSIFPANLYEQHR